MHPCLDSGVFWVCVESVDSTGMYPRLNVRVGVGLLVDLDAGVMCICRWASRLQELIRFVGQGMVRW